jgi:replication factor C subunit 2/4
MLARKNKKTWVEKYRPKTLDTLVQQEDIKQVIEYAREHDAMPHMLLYGPAGTGKTTTALAICKYLYWQPDKNILENEKVMRERVLELNASDDRGIQFVREDIKSFAQNTISEHPGLPRFKIIILDESDAMTSDSQFALRMIIELYSSTTRFIMMCNFVNKIIMPIKSRTMKIRYKAITLPVMENMIENIAKKEKLTIEKDFIKELRIISKGDMRKSINLLENVYYLYNKFDIKDLRECAGLLEKSYIENIINIIGDPNTTPKNILFLVNDFKNESYSSLILIEDIFNHIVSLNIKDKLKSKIILCIVDVDAALNNNADETIQLIHLFMIINQCLTI